ncbi:hypothetical protein ACFS27_13845 [Promicromonospora vindobonensis]|uniref:DUF3322 domain-containing protein n=1 Tax=Promicromonospora vindobonensis TaxID=195748 RepID=A0ABW5VW91_9MICO
MREIRQSIWEFGAPIPYRYDLSPRIQRATGRIDTLEGAIGLLTRRPFGEARLAAIGAVAETATDTERADIARWLDTQNPRNLLAELQPWHLQTQTDDEDADLSRLRRRLGYLGDPSEREPDLTIEAGQVPVIAEDERRCAERALMDAFGAARRESASAARYMSVAADGLIWVDHHLDEIDFRDHTSETRDAYTSLRLLYGDQFTVTGNKVAR